MYFYRSTWSWGNPQKHPQIYFQTHVKILMKGGKPVNKLELNRIKEVGKKTIADFIRSETGSVGIKNAAMIGACAGAFALAQASEAITVTASATITITFSDGSVLIAV